MPTSAGRIIPECWLGTSSRTRSWPTPQYSCLWSQSTANRKVSIINVVPDTDKITASQPAIGKYCFSALSALSEDGRASRIQRALAVVVASGLFVDPQYAADFIIVRAKEGRIWRAGRCIGGRVDCHTTCGPSRFAAQRAQRSSGGGSSGGDSAVKEEEAQRTQETLAAAATGDSSGGDSAATE